MPSAIAQEKWAAMMDHFVKNYQPQYNPQAQMQTSIAPYGPQLQKAFPEPQVSDNPPAGAEVPAEQRFLNAINALASGMALGKTAVGLGGAMLRGGEAGALFPEATKTATDLPVVQAGSKTGDPHALFAYNDGFGENGAQRALYNVYGDPAHPAIQTRGWGSSVPKEELDKLNIPIIGRQPNAQGVPAQ